MSSKDLEIRIVKISDGNFALIVGHGPILPLSLSHKGFPISEDVFQQVSRPDLSLAVGVRDPIHRFPGSPVGQSLKKFGSFLLEQLFWSHKERDLDTVWREFLKQDRGRLRLCLADEVSIWPWETLYDAHHLNGFLALGNISIVRQQKMAPFLKPPDLSEEPLRMLVVFADPLGDLSEALPNEELSPITAERQAIEQALQPLLTNNDLQIDWIEPGQGLSTLEKIKQKVEAAKNQYHILHYFGHGNHEHQGQIYGESNTRGDPQYLGWEQLQLSLGNELKKNLRLVVLNACNLAQADDNLAIATPYTNLASAFLNAGAGMVVAMQYPIRKETANQFTGTFYRHLQPYLFSSATEIEEAVHKARVQIAHSSNYIEWITPVIFTRMANDTVFRLSKERLKKYALERTRQEEKSLVLMKKGKDWQETLPDLSGLIGMQINDRYKIIRMLGAGGMGTVYLANDLHVDNREVAFKILPSNLSNDFAFRERFRREAKIIVQVESKAIVPVYDYGEYQSQPYLVMRYMREGSLADRLKAEKKLSLKESNRIIKRICYALDNIHNKDVFHRDLKPSNILFDSHNEAYLADFGIAKAIQESGEKLTGTNQALGAPAYMSPEQIRGDDIDHLTDIYQMGIVLFEMWTGQIPFEARTIPELYFRHLSDPIPSALDLNPTLPLACDHVIKKAMAKSKYDRYPTIAALAEAVNKLSEDYMNERTEIDRLLREIELECKAERWVPAAEKVVSILRIDPDSKNGNDWREKLRKKATELLVGSSDKRNEGEQIMRILA